MPNDMNERVIAEFRANQGRVGGFWSDKSLILLNTIGARSRNVQTVPLGYIQRSDDILIVGRGDGNERQPAWYYNLLANPDITYELGGDTIAATARLLAGTEREAAWDDMAAINPSIARGPRTAGGRAIPVFTLTPR